MKIVFCSLFLGFAGWVGAQPGIQWQRSYGGSLNDEATEVVQTNDGGYIVSGTTVSDDGDVGTNNGFNEFWVLKLDSLGLVQWKNTYGGSNHDDALALESTMDGGYIMAGFTMSNDGDVSGNHGDFDAWVLKLDSLGTIQWQKCLGGSGWEEAWDIKQTPDGGFIVVGRAGSVDGDVTINHGFLDYWVVKLNVLGAIEWQKSLGGSGLDLGYAVDVTSDGGFIVAGESQSEDGNVTKNSGSSDYWVVKLDIEGKIEWEKSYGGSLLDRANDIKQTRDGGYMVFGQSASNDGDVTNAHGNYDNWLVKLSETGEIEWQKTLGGSSEDYAKSFEQLEDGGYVTLGTSMSTNGDVLGNNGIMDIWVVRLSELGDIQWQKTLGGTKTEWGNAIQQTEDDGFILAGYNWSINGDASTCNGKSDYWIVKLAPESSPTTQPTTQPLNLYPNPATQAITIQIPDTESTLNIQITDLIGRELGRQTIPNGGTVDIKSLPNGVYLVSARTESGEVFLGRVCKQE